MRRPPALLIAAGAIALLLGLSVPTVAFGNPTSWIKLLFTPQAGHSATSLSCGWHSGACGATVGTALDFPGGSSDTGGDVYFRVFGFIPSGADQWIGWGAPITASGTTCKTTYVNIYDRNQNLLAGMWYTHTYRNAVSTINIWVAQSGRMNQVVFAGMTKDPDPPPPTPAPPPEQAENLGCKYHQPDPWWTGVHLHEYYQNGSETILLRDGGDCTFGDRYPCGSQWPYPPYNPQDWWNDWARALCIGDADCDLWTNSEESTIGTDPNDACGGNAWPPDLYPNNCVNVQDILLFRGPIQPGAPYNPRYDLKTDGRVNVQDVLIMRPVINTCCTP